MRSRRGGAHRPGEVADGQVNDDRRPGPAASPARPAWRRPAVLLAIVLDVTVTVGALVLVANGTSPVVLALAAILAIAPWAAIMDDSQRPRRR